MTIQTAPLQDDFYRREGREPGAFRYFHPDGSALDDAGEIDRLSRLAVPPAWTDVFLSPDPGHELQAFGRDAAGRLQYRYHPDYTERNAGTKWRRLARFADRLPLLREASAADLRRHGLPPRKVAALMTRLLGITYFRAGSDEYAARHRSYGLTTLRKDHVRVRGAIIEFDFQGKHGIRQRKATADRTLAANMERLLELPGPWLFQGEEDGGIRRIRCGDLNGYIRQAMGRAFSAKDFRTWGGTLLAAEFLAEAGPPASEREARRTLVECIRRVAGDLGNTPAVTRSHYICPYVFDRYLEGKVLDDYEPKESRLDVPAGAALTRSEEALKRLLQAGIRRNPSPRHAMGRGKGGEREENPTKNE